MIGGKAVAVLILSLAVLASGCTTTQDSGVMEKPAGLMGKDAGAAGPEGVMEKNGTAAGGMETAMAKYQGQVLAGKSALLLDFVQADYEQAMQTNRLVVLYFYADWCPICKAEVPQLYAAFDQLQSENVVGFRVNFNDGSTDDFERGLAEKHGVAYQHTKVFTRNGQQVLKSPETWDTQRYLTEIGKAS
ncbi:MAG: thioredoxin family protein [Candidatus Aenigmarchaeota archaeon]|nr:thioredoxin family protein [Candidatus Aenigmarchaeota archaeon]